MISGLVLPHVYGRTFGADFGWADVRPFLWSRFARISPVHVVTLILLLPFYGNQGFFGAPLAENLLFIQIFLAPTLTWDGGAWPIIAEWYAYLFSPFRTLTLLGQISYSLYMLQAPACFPPSKCARKIFLRTRPHSAH